MVQSNKIDLWLTRVGYLSQIGTLIVMIITIFYTVIPLYRTASLEESIAKKESELKLLSSKINEYERKERKVALADYVRSISYFCTSLSKPILVPLPPDDINFYFKENELTILNQDIEGCLKKPEYVDIVMNILSNNDRITLKKELDVFSNKIANLRVEKINEYREIEKKLHKNEIDIVQQNDEDDSLKLLDAIVRHAGASEKDINTAKINSYLVRLERQFEDDIRKEISKFNNIKWDDHE